MAAQSASSAELVTSLRFASDPGANFVDPFLQFRKVRPRPVYLFAATTAAELVVIDCGERLEFADYVGLGCRFQRGVTSQAPSERCDQFRKVKTADNLDRLFVGVLRTRAVAGFDDCVHQQTPVSREERPVFACHYVEQLIVLRLGIVGGIKSKQA